MKKRNKKVSNLLPGEYYCYKCDKYMKVEFKQKGETHCVKCEKRAVESVKNYVDKPLSISSQKTIDAREQRKRAADLMEAIEHKKIIGNHLVDYL